MRLSETIASILQDYENEPLPLEKLLERTQEHGFGLISGVLTLPLLIPLPIPLAGFSTLLGSGVILMGLQLVWGFHQPHLPPFLARLKFSSAVARGLLQNVNRVLRPLERLSRTRLVLLSHHWLLRRFLGLCLVWNAFLMALPLPIPMTNWLPAYTILAFAVGLLESDGLLISIGYGLTGATTVFFSTIVKELWGLLLQYF